MTRPIPIALQLRELVSHLNVGNNVMRFAICPCRGIYGRKYPPSLIPVDNLTYVMTPLLGFNIADI